MQYVAEEKKKKKKKKKKKELQIESQYLAGKTQLHVFSKSFSPNSDVYKYHVRVSHGRVPTWQTLVAVLPGRTVGRGMGSCRIWPETHCKA